jgi:isopentenyl phosphate kinase
VLVHALLSRNIPAFTLQPSAALLTARKKIKEWFLKPLKELLRLNMVPVIYGDAVIDVTQGSAILSTEMLFFYIVSKIEIKKVIVVGIEDGVYSSDGTVIPEITPKNIDYITPHLKASQGIDITGGMFHKVYELLKISKKGPICQIINGLKKDTLKNAILEKCNEGTVIKHI